MALMLTFDDLDPMNAASLAHGSPHHLLPSLAAADDELDEVEEDEDEEDDDDEEEDEEDEDDDDDDEDDEDEDEETEDVAEDARNARGQLRRQNGHVMPQVRPR